MINSLPHCMNSQQQSFMGLIGALVVIAIKTPLIRILIKSVIIKIARCLWKSCAVWISQPPILMRRISRACQNAQICLPERNLAIWVKPIKRPLAGAITHAKRRLHLRKGARLARLCCCKMVRWQSRKSCKAPKILAMPLKPQAIFWVWMRWGCRAVLNGCGIRMMPEVMK